MKIPVVFATDKNYLFFTCVAITSMAKNAKSDTFYQVYILADQEFTDEEKLLEKLEVERCIECGMCTYICPSKIEVTDMVGKGKRRQQIANRMKKK